MIFDLLSEQEKKLTKLVKLKANETLFYEDDVCHTLGIVLEGELIISSITYQGNEIIYNKIKKGDVFGNNLLFVKDNKYRGDVKATKKSQVILIDKDNLVSILKNNEVFLIAYLSINASFTKSLNSKIKLLSFNGAKERLLYYFYLNNNRIVYKNITSLAKELYLAREVTSRLISMLEKDNQIIRNKHELILRDFSS